MRRQFAVYCAIGAVLAVLSLGTVGWAMSVAAPNPAAAAAAVSEPLTEEVPPAAPPIPADVVIQGSATAIAANLDLESDASVPQANQIKICDVEVDGWVRSQAIRLNDSGVGLSIQVAAWRAGAAAGAFDDLEKGAANCAQVSSNATDEEFRASVSSPDGQWASGVRRVGDVLIAASASSASADPGAWVDRVLAEGQKVMKARLAGICVDPTSARENDHAARDPYSGKYAGFKVASPRKLEDQSVLTKDQIAEVKAQQPESSWVAPPGVPNPLLAPIKVPPGSPPAPVDADPATALRGPAPVLVDIAKILPPKEVEPTTDADELKEPATPDVGDGVSVAMIPAVDNSGPGCGWDFTSTVTPETSEADLQAGARQAVIAALLRDTEVQGERMVAALAWPAAHQQWVVRASIAMSWEAYRDELDLAEAKLEKAEDAYEKSLADWYRGSLAPEPTPTPTPTGTGSPSEPSIPGDEGPGETP